MMFSKKQKQTRNSHSEQESSSDPLTELSTYKKKRPRRVVNKRTYDNESHSSSDPLAPVSLERKTKRKRVRSQYVEDEVSSESDLITETQSRSSKKLTIKPQRPNKGKARATNKDSDTDPLSFPSKNGKQRKHKPIIPYIDEDSSSTDPLSFPYKRETFDVLDNGMNFEISEDNSVDSDFEPISRNKPTSSSKSLERTVRAISQSTISQHWKPLNELSRKHLLRTLENIATPLLAHIRSDSKKIEFKRELDRLILIIENRLEKIPVPRSSKNSNFDNKKQLSTNNEALEKLLVGELEQIKQMEFQLEHEKEQVSLLTYL